MGTIILHKLEAKTRTIFNDGRCTKEKSAAFIGATDDELCQFGIGLFNEEKRESLFWAMLCPHQLITAWRGLHILDKTTHILHGTVYNAYRAGEVNSDSNDVKKAIADLSEQIPDIEELREEVLKMKIDDEVLDEMLRVCNSPDNSIDVSVRELEEAVRAGIIKQTAEVSRAYKIDAEQRAQQERDEMISKQPLPESKSFRRFCEKFGINNLFSDPYDDWPGYWPMERIDETLVYSGLRYKSTVEVWCAENPQGSDNTGHIGQPVLQLNDRRTVVLPQVYFKDDDMWVTIQAVENRDESAKLTLSALSTLEPRFVGLTFDRNDKPTLEDMDRGYFAVRDKTRNPIKKILRTVASI